MKRVGYRARQFWQTLTGRLTPAEQKQIADFLAPRLYALFLRLSPGEQYHAYRVWKTVRHWDYLDPDLGIAALLHDVGKTRTPLRPWERALAVLGRWLWPELAQRWSVGEPQDWRRAFVVAEQHPGWGAELAAQAGAAPDALALIQRHQEPAPDPPQSELDRRLDILIAADDRH